MGHLKSGRGALADDLADRCERLGIEVIERGTEQYPDRLEHLTRPPERLFLLGDSRRIKDGGVAIVGSRRGSAYGRRMARALGAAAARIGEVVLSGLALGVDAEAHEGAMEGVGALDQAGSDDARGPAIAVVGAGPEMPTPRANAALHRRLVEHGTIVSEYPPGMSARPYHFPERNRIIAALADEVIVVEAAERSGALITARVALELGRNVSVVPGPIDVPFSVGSNRLLADGAAPIVDLKSWVAERGQFAFQLPEQRQRPSWPQEFAVLEDALVDPKTPDALALETGQPLSELLNQLLELELAGLVRRLPGPIYRRAS